MTLIPFTPSDNDLHKKVVDPRVGEATPLLTDLPLTSVSHWDTKHLCALNVGVLLDLDNHRIIPGKHIPKDDDEGKSVRYA